MFTFRVERPWADCLLAQFTPAPVNNTLLTFFPKHSHWINLPLFVGLSISFYLALSSQADVIATVNAGGGWTYGFAYGASGSARSASGSGSVTWSTSAEGFTYIYNRTIDWDQLAFSYNITLQSPTGYRYQGGPLNNYYNPYYLASTAHVSIVWTDGLFLPGERPDDPREYEDDPGDGDNGVQIVGGVDIANDITGSYLTSLPVDGSYGVTSPVYFGDSTGVTPPSDLGARGYVFLLQSGLNFTSFTTPDGIPGDTTGAYLAFGSTIVPYLPGTTYNFSSPVEGFALLGLDPTVLYTDASAPFVQGFTFDQSGPAIIKQYVVAVPEVESLGLLFTACGFVAGVVGVRRQRRPYVRVVFRETPTRGCKM